MSEMKQEHKSSPAYNTQPAGLEKWANEIVRSLPFQIPEGGRKWLAENAWWLTLAGGILTTWGLWNTWRASQVVNQIGAWADQVSRSLGVATTTSELGFGWYIILAMLAAQAALMFMAFQPLKEHKKSGWNLLFYSSLVSTVMGVAYVFIPYYGFGSLIGMVIGVAIGWFVLFNVREYFTK
jgi:hypothetical protein